MAESKVQVNTRMPRKLREIMEAHVSRDTHMNESDFVREAVKEKLQREAPDIYQKLVRVKPKP